MSNDARDCIVLVNVCIIIIIIIIIGPTLVWSLFE